jgi:predicted porin
MNKIKTTIFVLALIGFSNLALAQAQFAVGIKGGLNFANIDVKGTVATNYNNRTGYHGGAFALIKVASFGIQPELIFSKQGTKYSVNTTDYEANFDYINVPIMIKFYLPLGLNLQAGPQFGFLTTAELKQKAGSVSTTQDAKNFYKSNDTSISMGAGWDLPFGLTVDARYNLGLSKINAGTNNNDTKNQVFQVSVGYKLLKLGK